MIALNIVRVHVDVDLRGVHKMRQRVKVTGLRAELFLNRARTMARIIDSEQNVHNHYAPEGEVYDLASIQRQVKAFSLTLTMSVKNQARVNATPKKKKKMRAAA